MSVVGQSHWSLRQRSHFLGWDYLFVSPIFLVTEITCFSFIALKFYWEIIKSVQQRLRKLVVAASLASAQVSRCLLIPVLKCVFLPSPLNYKNKYMLTFHFKALCKGKNLACEELNSRKGSRSLKAGEKLKQDLKAWGYARRWLLCSSKKKKPPQTSALLFYLSTSQWLNAGLRAVEFCFE